MAKKPAPMSKDELFGVERTVEKFMTQTEIHRLIFSSQMGELIDGWSGIESQLCMIFLICSGPQDPQLSAKIFHEAELFRYKLSMVDAAILHKLELSTVDHAKLRENPLGAEWKRLKNKAEKLSKLRNKVAHGMIWLHPADEGCYQLISIIRSVKWEKQVDQALPEIDLATLKLWDDKFDQLNTELVAFHKALMQEEQDAPAE